MMKRVNHTGSCFGVASFFDDVIVIVFMALRCSIECCFPVMFNIIDRYYLLERERERDLLY